MDTHSSEQAVNPVPILVLSPRYSSDSRILRSAALKIGWHVERLGDWNAPERLRGRKLIFSGEPSFMKVIANSLSWALLDAPLDWLTQLPLLYRKRSIRYMTLSEARVLSQPTFVKPAAEKSFAAAIYASGAQLPPSDHKLLDSTPVLTSEPVSWEIEFRFYIRERRVITYSSYWRIDHITLQNDGTWEAMPTEIAEAQSFITSLLADLTVKIPPAVVIDIGKMRERGWAVIESNAAWAAGIYGCDPIQILSVLERASIKRSQLPPEDALWQVNRNAQRTH